MERLVDPLTTTDAKLWADEFMKVKARLGEQKFDHAMMLGWFANAIMQGYDEGRRRAKADAQATVDLAKAEGAAEVRKVIQQRLIDVRLARSVARLSFAQDEYDAQISALESILKQCEEPFSSNNENGLDLQATVEALQAVIRQMGEQAAVLTKDGMAAKAQVEALQRERDEARHTADVYQKLYGTAVMDRAIVHNEKADLQAALDAERASGGRER